MFSELHSYIFFFNDSSTTNIYTLSLHDALPIYFNGTVHFSFQDPEGLPITFVQPPAHRQFTTSASQISARLIHAGFVVRDRERRSQRERSEEHTTELQSPVHIVCRLLLEKKI